MLSLELSFNPDICMEYMRLNLFFAAIADEDGLL